MKRLKFRVSHSLCTWDTNLGMPDFRLCVSNDLIKHLSQTIILCRELNWHIFCWQKFSAYQQTEASLLTWSSSSILCSSHPSKPEALLSSLPSDQNSCEICGPQLWQILSKQMLSAFPSSVSDLRIFPELLFIFSFYSQSGACGSSWARSKILATAANYTTATATLDPSHIRDLCYSLP